MEKERGRKLIIIKKKNEGDIIFIEVFKRNIERKEGIKLGIRNKEGEMEKIVRNNIEKGKDFKK